MSKDSVDCLEDCVEQAVSLVPSEVSARFGVDPRATLINDFGLRVTAVDHLADSRRDGGACDGVSFLGDGVVLYAPTPNSRRENFTLAHELGHWLTENAPDAYDWLADQEEPGALLETVCDRIAQRLLLPGSAAESVIGHGPIRAQHVMDLYHATQASRPACSIALASRLPSLGMIVLVDRATATVSHASVNPHPEHGWPVVYPWRNQRLDASHPLLRLSPGSSTSRLMTWRDSLARQAAFYVDAITDGPRIIAVFSDTDLWEIEKFHPGLDHDFDKRLLLTGHCCGTAFERRGYPCPTCERPFCPQCGECRCGRDSKREVRCTVCTLSFQKHLVIDGKCVDCRS